MFNETIPLGVIILLPRIIDHAAWKVPGMENPLKFLIKGVEETPQTI